MMILKKILLRCQPVCSAGMEAIGLEVLLPVEERKVVAGKIKVLPEDFCVKEINPRGIVADLQQCIGEEYVSVVPEVRATTPAAPSATSASPQQEKEAAVAVGPALSFEELVAGPALDQVAQLHETVLSLLKDGKSAAEVERLEHVRLAAPHQKDGRRRVHAGIKERFPFLRTEGQGDAILCRPEVAGAVALRGLLSFDDLQRLQAFVARGPLAPAAADGVTVGPLADKDKRAAVHRACALHYRGLSTKALSVTGEGGAVETLISITWAPKKGHKRKRGEAGGQGGDGSGGSREVSVVVLRKEGVEHLLALSRLAQALKLPLSSLGVAGIKDKRAVTYQFVSLAGWPPSRPLPAIHDRGLQVGQLQACDAPLLLGQLQGNRFRIRIREPHLVGGEAPGLPPEGAGSAVSEELRSLVHASCGRLRERGFINYFGTQRLGNPLVPGQLRSYHVGRALLRRDFSEAVRLLLEPRQADSEAVRAAKAVFWSLAHKEEEAAAAALKKMPACMARERKLLQGLNRYGRSEEWKALRCLPYSIRLQWLGAYQSWVWNRAASERLRVLGFRPVAGDLILPPPHSQADASGPAVPRVLSHEEAEGLEPFDPLLYSVVLPLPGYGVTYPEHAVKQFYEELLSADGLLQQGLGRRSEEKEFDDLNLKGTYRHLLVKPKGLEAEWMEEGDLVVNFSLPAGSFATVMLREVMGGDDFLAEEEAPQEGEAEGEAADPPEGD